MGMYSLFFSFLCRKKIITTAIFVYKIHHSWHKLYYWTNIGDKGARNDEIC